MAYKKIKSHKMTEEELRQLWKEEYCYPTNPILTFDNVLVRFFESKFDHCFYESFERKERDKSILSLNRLEKMLWIKDTIQDPSAMLKQGWDRDKKTYNNKRRVAFVKESYVVIIEFTGLKKAVFVTAYEVHVEDNITNIMGSPEWVKEAKYYGNDEA
jgi:hypothetical protein